MSVKVEPLTGHTFFAALPALAELRIAVFRAYPYLYEGSMDYEKDYLSHFSKAKNAIIVAASDNGRIVGVATAAPLTDHRDNMAPVFIKAGFDPDEVFYFGESVLLPEYRGHGIGHKFFDEREAQAKRCTNTRGHKFKYTAFCGVVRAEDDPRTPDGYSPLDAFWIKRGYTKTEGLVTSFKWQEIGETEQTEKPMQFWIKRIAD